MPSHLIHLDVEKAVELIGLHAFTDRRGDTIVTYLFPDCGAGLHVGCTPMIPRIGTNDNPRKWLGWQHCKCHCHEWTETKNGWSVRPALR